MENRSDYEKRMGEKLEAAYMLEDIEPVMSREEFHRLIKAAEKKKKRRKTLLGLVAASVALCLVCSGFVVGMTMGESASAGKDDETKTVQQGDSVIIGSGVSENDRNVGVTTKTYTDIEDIPEDIREEIRFLSSDEFELEKVKVVEGREHIVFELYYVKSEEEITIKEESNTTSEQFETVVSDCEKIILHKGKEVYLKKYDYGDYALFYKDNVIFSISIMGKNKIEVVLDDLLLE